MWDSISEKDELKIGMLKEKVAHLIHPQYDHFFNYLRWLEAAKFDVKKAVKRMSTHLRVRKSMGLDREVLPEIAPSYVERWPVGFIDEPDTCQPPYDNCAFVGAHFNEHYNYADIRKNIRHGDFIHGIMYQTEHLHRRIVARERRTGRRSGWIQIVDFEGIRIDMSSVHPFINIMKLCDSNFPGAAAKILMINASPIVMKLWSITKHLIPHQNLGFIEVSEAKEYVNPRLLPVQWGGDLVDSFGDPMCGEHFNIPRAHRKHNIDWHPSELKELGLDQTITVGRGGSEWITVPVPAVGSNFNCAPVVLKWTFFTNNWFSFDVYFTTDETEQNPDAMDLVFGPFPYFTETSTPESGHLVYARTAEPGFYKLRFGNEGSIFSRLKVDYRIDLIDEDMSKENYRPKVTF